MPRAWSFPGSWSQRGDHGVRPQGCSRGLIGNSWGPGMSEISPEGSGPVPWAEPSSRSSRGDFPAADPEKSPFEAKAFGLSFSFKEFSPRIVQALLLGGQILPGDPGSLCWARCSARRNQHGQEKLWEPGSSSKCPNPWESRPSKAGLQQRWAELCRR